MDIVGFVITPQSEMGFSLADAITRVGVATAFVVLTGFFATWWLRRSGLSRQQLAQSPILKLLGNHISSNSVASHTEMELISYKRIAPGQALAVVRWKGRALLLGCTSQTIRVLCEAVDELNAIDDEQI